MLYRRVRHRMHMQGVKIDFLLKWNPEDTIDEDFDKIKAEFNFYMVRIPEHEDLHTSFKRKSRVGFVAFRFKLKWRKYRTSRDAFDKIREKFCQVIDNVKNYKNYVSPGWGLHQPNPLALNFVPLDPNNPPQGRRARCITKKVE